VTFHLATSLDASIVSSDILRIQALDGKSIIFIVDYATRKAGIRMSRYNMKSCNFVANCVNNSIDSRKMRLTCGMKKSEWCGQ